jgi:signal transduction histidine kinase
VLSSRWPLASLFGQLLVFVGLSLTASMAVSMLLIFNLPPPAPDFYRLSEVVQAFRGSVAASDRGPLGVTIDSRPPGPAIGGPLVYQIRNALAHELAVPVDHVVIASDMRASVADRRVFRIIRDRLIQEGTPREEHFLIAPFEVGVLGPDGRWRIVSPNLGVSLSAWQQRALLWFTLSALAMAPIAYLFARRLSAPISLFAAHAERVGRDPSAPPLRIGRSASELNIAVLAFNDMQERLRRYVEDRTAMVAAIAHDLRTPLTRLRFRIESAPEDLRVKMASDIDQMEQMISATLTFVRDATRAGERTPLELSSLLESLCDEMAETGADTEVERAEKVVLEGDPLALRRLFTNLLDNAVKFGGRARARIFRRENAAVVEIEDDGPGIPAEDAERVFDPFYRREGSRSRQTGGIGLGLAVVRSIARGHGGDVELLNRAGGGLTVRVQFPI